MILKLHIWIGNPQSVRELDVLTDALGRSVPLPRGDVTVICEAHEMPIHDLAARLTKSPSMQREVQNLGGHLRAGTATAMFGIEAEALSLKEETPSGLTYLGSLSMSE